MTNGPRQFDFDEQLRMSEGVAERADIAQNLLDNIPGALQAHRAHSVNDRNGTDYWVEHSSGRHLSVDIKARAEDWAYKPRPCDDLALESWSVVGQKTGWTRDSAKRTDYILWFWEDSGRWLIIPFPLLCAVFSEHWEQWAKQYKTRNQANHGYDSQCIFVPRIVVWEAIFTRFGGRTKKSKRYELYQVPF